MFDFFRKKKLIGGKVEVASFSYGDAGKVFEERAIVLREKERRILSEIEGRFGDFYISVEEKLGVLEGIDIEGKKEHDKAKILVRQGLDKYIYSVRVLLRELKKKSSLGAEKFNSKNWKGSDSGNPEEFSFAGGLVKFVSEIGKVFIEFEKKSAKVYERATYLVGDEMKAVRNEIRKFYNGLLKTFEEEESFLGDLSRVREIRLKFDEVGGIEGKLKEFEEEIRLNEEGVVKLGRKVVGLREEVDVIRKSVEYVSGLKVVEEIGVLSNRIGKEVLKLKGFVDFKKLIGIVHVNEKELGVVKRFRDSFVSEFSSDDGKRLFDLLRGSGMMSSEIGAQVLVIGELKDELGLVKKSVGVDPSVGKLREVEKIEGEIELRRIAGVKVRGRLKEVGVKLEETKGEVVLAIRGLAVSC